MNIIEKNEVRGYVDENSTVMLNVEDIAVGLELTEPCNRNKVKWTYVNECLRDLNYDKRVKKNDFIPEIYFHRLAINTGRFRFCEYFYFEVANEIIPYIREQSQKQLFKTAFDEIHNTASKHGKQLQELAETQNNFDDRICEQGKDIAELREDTNQIKCSVAELKEFIDPENIIVPIMESARYTSNFVSDISKQFDIKPRTIWRNLEMEMNKRFGVIFQTELVNAKKQLEAFYYRKCQEYGGTRHVPKNVKRPSQIKAVTLNQLWSSNLEWYQAVVNILESMKKSVKAA